MGKVEIKYSHHASSLIADGSKVWACYPSPEYQGWDFGTPGSSPVQLFNISTLPNSNMLWDPNLSGIKDSVTRKVIFQLSGSFAKSVNVQHEGHYLVAGYESGEILIFESNHILL